MDIVPANPKTAISSLPPPFNSIVSNKVTTGGIWDVFWCSCSLHLAISFVLTTRKNFIFYLQCVQICIHGFCSKEQRYTVGWRLHDGHLGIFCASKITSSRIPFLTLSGTLLFMEDEILWIVERIKIFLPICVEISICFFISFTIYIFFFFIVAAPQHIIAIPSMATTEITTMVKV